MGVSPWGIWPFKQLFYRKKVLGAPAIAFITKDTVIIVKKGSLKILL